MEDTGWCGTHRRFGVAQVGVAAASGCGTASDGPLARLGAGEPATAAEDGQMKPGHPQHDSAFRSASLSKSVSCVDGSSTVAPPELDP